VKPDEDGCRLPVASEPPEMPARGTSIGGEWYVQRRNKRVGGNEHLKAFVKPAVAALSTESFLSLLRGA